MGHIYSAVVFCPGFGDCHSVSKGYILRGDIGISYNGTDPICIQLRESILLTCSGGFRCIPLVPISPLKQIAYLQNLLIAPGCMVSPH